MKNKKSLSEDEFRQEVDGFSIKHTDKEKTKEGFKTVNEPIYPTHSADLDEYRKQ